MNIKVCVCRARVRQERGKCGWYPLICQFPEDKVSLSRPSFPLFVLKYCCKVSFKLTRRRANDDEQSGGVMFSHPSVIKRCSDAPVNVSV